jgi:hypothetical protein
VIVIRRSEFGKSVLDDSIFKRMEAEDGEAGLGRDELDDSFQKPGKAFEFMVDLNTQGLKEFGSRMNLALLRSPVTDFFDELAEFGCGLDFSNSPSGSDLLRELFGLFEFSKLLEKMSQFGFRILI